MADFCVRSQICQADIVSQSFYICSSWLLPGAFVETSLVRSDGHAKCGCVFQPRPVDLRFQIEVVCQPSQRKSLAKIVLPHHHRNKDLFQLPWLCSISAKSLRPFETEVLRSYLFWCWHSKAVHTPCGVDYVGSFVETSVMLMRSLGVARPRLFDLAALQWQSGDALHGSFSGRSTLRFLLALLRFCRKAFEHPCFKISCEALPDDGSV